MSHTVIQVDSKVSSSTEASRLKNKIKDYLVDQGFDLHDNAVNDGSDMNGTITLRVMTDHNVTTQANIFFDWLKQFCKNNKSKFKEARLRIHDCQHFASPSEEEFKQDIRGHYPSISKEELDSFLSNHDYQQISSNHQCETGNAWEL